VGELDVTGAVLVGPCIPPPWLPPPPPGAAAAIAGAIAIAPAAIRTLRLRFIVQVLFAAAGPIGRADRAARHIVRSDKRSLLTTNRVAGLLFLDPSWNKQGLPVNSD
jgi:hypothetical protein